MKHRIEIEIESGATTCASKPGHFCKYLCLGYPSICLLFDSDPDEDLLSEKGWIKRKKKCMEATI